MGWSRGQGCFKTIDGVMKVIIDTKEKTFEITGWVTIPELTDFVDKHGFGEYIMKFNETPEATITNIRKGMGVDRITYSDGSERDIVTIGT